MYKPQYRPKGFMILLNSVRRMQAKGLSFWAPPCNSWIFLSQSIYKRSMERPWGDTSKMRTREQNKLACRVLLLLRLCVAFQVYWLLEQPMSSLLCEFPKFKKASKKLGANMVTCWMHSYVAATAKGAKLLGNVPYLQKLKTTAKATFDGIKGVRQITTKKTFVSLIQKLLKGVLCDVLLQELLHYQSDEGIHLGGKCAAVRHSLNPQP